MKYDTDFKIKMCYEFCVGLSCIGICLMIYSSVDLYKNLVHISKKNGTINPYILYQNAKKIGLEKKIKEDEYNLLYNQYLMFANKDKNSLTFEEFVKMYNEKLFINQNVENVFNQQNIYIDKMIKSYMNKLECYIETKINKH